MKKHRSGFTQPLKRGAGFTLIELLVAILIFSTIVSVVYSTFSTGISVWKRTKISTRASMTINSVLEDLARDLRGAVAYDDPDNGLQFIGEKDRLYFCYLSETVSGDSRYKEIYRACYVAEPSAEEVGKFDLFKRGAPLMSGGFNIDEIPERQLISALDDFKIEYAYRDPEEEKITWEEEWGKEDTDEVTGLPRAIRIGISKGDMILTKYIWVPTGELVDLEEE